MEVLEARLLLSADLPGLALDPAALGQTPAAREVVVLDSGLPDLEAMRSWLGAEAPQAEVLVLRAGQDALAQIGRHLARGEAAGAVQKV